MTIIKDAEDLIGVSFWALLFLAIGSGLLVLLFMIGADHRVRRYYIGGGTDTTYVVSCVMADEPWEMDSTVFCSRDPKEVLDYMNRANQQLMLVKR